MGVSFETYLRRHWDVQRDVAATSPQRLNARWGCVNTRLAFDTQILLPNLNNPILTNPMNKDFNYKVVYNLKIDRKKRVNTKTGCIKDDSDISWETFNFLLETVSFEDNIGHLYIVDIEFDCKNTTEKEFAYNEI